jgi:succinyl-CoA synthetase beta subunit
MKLLEYEAKKILTTHTVPVPRSFIAVSGTSPEFLPAVIKSQVPVGGRGKAGGIAIVSNPDEFNAAVTKISSLEIKGFTPSKLLAEELVSIKQELYLSILIDKQVAAIVLMAHTKGGVEVEDNAAEDFLRVTLTSSAIKTAGEALSEYFELPEKAFVLQELVEHLYDCFVTNDAVLCEINPLIYTTDGKIIAGDCKMELDDAAVFRHPDWNFEQDKAEANFVTLDANGEVATIANGAGLAMATVDAVADAGLVPANFLDIGGGANEASVLAAFERIMQYPHIKVIIINIFAGITRCDEIAKAVIAAKSHIPDLPPLYIRLAGTNFEQAVELLSQQHIATLATLDECILAAKEQTS